MDNMYVVDYVHSSNGPKIVSYHKYVGFSTAYVYDDEQSISYSIDSHKGVFRVHIRIGDTVLASGGQMYKLLYYELLSVKLQNFLDE